MQKHFVTFFSPGTFVAEQATKPIESWDVPAAVAMARGITERYGARPYGFRFSTRTRGDNDLDSRETAKSCLYYLGGQVETLAKIKRRNDPTERILRDNMECNGWKKVVTNRNSWRWTQPLEEGDVILDVSLDAVDEPIMVKK